MGEVTSLGWRLLGTGADRFLAAIQVDEYGFQNIDAVGVSPHTSQGLDTG